MRIGSFRITLSELDLLSLKPVLQGLFIPYLEGHVRFPAIKTHSVPNLLARSSASGEQPLKTEKSNSAGARINRESKNKR